MRLLLTGADGFLGWHTRVRLRALTTHEVVPVRREDWGRLGALVRDADAVIHVAGVNRGGSEDVEQDNIALAQAVADAVRDRGSAPRIVFANSIQAGNDSPYGRGKAAASQLLAEAARGLGAAYVDMRLPNLFGEHGRPHYNSFVATFVDAIVKQQSPTVEDRPVPLLHVQDAAQALIDGLTTTETALAPTGTPRSVRGVYDRLRDFHETYRTGDLPPLVTKLDVDLFNTLRASLFPGHYPIVLAVHEDDRGRLVEAVRAHGGQGQTFVSTSRPGITRGEHFHLSKVERFVVVSGRARICLRRLFSEDVVSFDVTGDRPAVVDMPTMWAHNIINTGDTELTTLFWTHRLFDPSAPDTFREPVHAEAAVPA